MIDENRKFVAFFSEKSDKDCAQDYLREGFMVENEELLNSGQIDFTYPFPDFYAKRDDGWLEINENSEEVGYYKLMLAIEFAYLDFLDNGPDSKLYMEYTEKLYEEYLTKKQKFCFLESLKECDQYVNRNMRLFQKYPVFTPAEMMKEIVDAYEGLLKMKRELKILSCMMKTEEIVSLIAEKRDLFLTSVRIYSEFIKSEFAGKYGTPTDWDLSENFSLSKSSGIEEIGIYLGGLPDDCRDAVSTKNLSGEMESR